MDAVRIRATTGLVALLGHPVTHSFSPAIHNAAFAAAGLDLVYMAFGVKPADLPAALAGLRALGIKGANITVPHKETVLKYLDIIEPRAARIGAVNTIVNEGGRLAGYNTDAGGFLRSLREAGYDPAGKAAVILGAGGAARAVAFALAEAGCSRLVVANRTPTRAQELVATLAQVHHPAEALSLKEEEIRPRLERAPLVVNTTSAGMEPATDTAPVPPGWLCAGQWVYDVVYNPPETRFLREARQRGCRAISGLGMLLYQGTEAFSLWTGQAAPVAVMDAALRDALAGGRNSLPEQQPAGDIT